MIYIYPVRFTLVAFLTRLIKIGELRVLISEI